MGFSVTTAHLVLFVTFLTAGNAFAGAFWATAKDVDEHRRWQAEHQESVAHTNISIVGTPVYDAVASRYTFNVENTGSTTLLASEVSYVVDGEWTDAVEQTAVEGDVTTDLWLPGEVMEVRLRPIGTSPTYLKVVTENGVSTYHR